MYTIGIIGLGLIGGSFAKAYREAGHFVYGTDADKSTEEYAKMAGIIDAYLTPAEISKCSLLLLSVYHTSVISWLTEHAELISPDCIVMDICGVKRAVCPEAFAIAKAYGFTYLGGHPMAGTQYSGIRHARANLFHGASFILVPKLEEDIRVLAHVKDLLLPVGIASVTVTDAATHDRNIAYTSQLAHVVSNAYVKSPRAKVHKGFSAGSYKDLTRVARLNETMWSELFLANADYLSEEIDSLILELKKYSDAIKTGDAATLTALLRDGRIRKEEAEQ